MAYKQIDERFWKDAKVKKLSKDGCLLFLYLLTSPHTHFSGLSEMSLNYASIDTPLTEKESRCAHKELCDANLIQYDAENEIVWIRNMHKYQIKSPKQIKGAEKQIMSLPRSILCKNLAEALSIPYPYPIDTLLIGYCPVEKTNEYPITHEISTENTLPIQEEAKAKEEAKEKVKVKAKKEYSDEFETFWNECPNKKAKGKAIVAFNKVRESGVELSTLVQAMKKYAASVIGKESHFIAHPASWLNAQRWTDVYSSAVASPSSPINQSQLDELRQRYGH